MHKRSTTGTFKLGDVLWFKHIHTDAVISAVVTVRGREDENDRLRVEVEGKSRPMLLLGQGNDGCFHLLVMSSKHRTPEEMQVCNGKTPKGKDSFIDCSSVIQYNGELLELITYRGKTFPKRDQPVAKDVLYKVLQLLPWCAADTFTRIEGIEAFRAPQKDDNRI